jgi:hypothetical protein
MALSNRLLRWLDGREATTPTVAEPHEESAPATDNGNLVAGRGRTATGLRELAGVPNGSPCGPPALPPGALRGRL